MKDKIKARFDEFKNDSFSQGILVGGVIGITSVLVTGRIVGLNFDRNGLYVPDALINHLRETGESLLAQKDDVQIAIALVPEV
jgi:hypothetical protein